MIFGKRNANLLQGASDIPMIREFGVGGADGYVFMGRGILHFQVRSEPLVAVHGAYVRNIDRALDLLEVYYEVAEAKKQVILSAVYMSVMTSYECLTDDMLKCLQLCQVAVSQKGRPPLHKRRSHLFSTLNFVPDDHIRALRYLYAFRNCLTHNAGVVDADFLKNIADIGPVPPSLSQYQAGQPLMLEAAVATSFADSLQQVAHALFPAAQDMLTKAGK